MGQNILSTVTDSNALFTWPWTSATYFMWAVALKGEPIIVPDPCWHVKPSHSAGWGRPPTQLIIFPDSVLQNDGPRRLQRVNRLKVAAQYNSSQVAHTGTAACSSACSHMHTFMVLNQSYFMFASSSLPLICTTELLFADQELTKWRSKPPHCSW